MKNNTNKTMKQLFLAASVALTMGVASATSVPGMPSDVFEFNQLGSNIAPSAGAGFDAIANINDILTSIGGGTNSDGSTSTGTGGSVINTDNYWSSFTSDIKTQTFDYTRAKPMIEELIFTVSGEIYDGTNLSVNNGYVDSGDDYYVSASLLNSTKNKDSSILRAATADDVNNSALRPDGRAAAVGEMISAGKWLDGGLKESGEAAVTLLSTIGYGTTGASPLGAATITTNTNDGSETVALNHDATTMTYDAANTTALLAAVLGTTTDPSTFQADADNAKIADAQAFVNANILISQIADQLKNGYLLDVAAATSAVNTVINHHNNFLASSIVAEAKSLKTVIKNVGYQLAAVGVGKGARVACTDSSGSVVVDNAEGCVKIGEQFKDITSNISNFGDSTTNVAAYNTAVDNIKAFATNLTTFNAGALAGYNATTAANGINGQFGTIMVASNDGDDQNVSRGEEIFNAFENSLINPYGFDSWTTSTNADILNEDNSVMFDASLEIAFDGNDLFTDGGLDSSGNAIGDHDDDFLELN